MGYIRSEADIEGERREHADPRGPSITRNQHTSWNGGRQETIGHCLIRQWPIVLDAVMVGFWPFSLTVLIIFSSPSVSPLPPPLHSEVAPSAPPRHPLCLRTGYDPVCAALSIEKRSRVGENQAHRNDGCTLDTSPSEVAGAATFHLVFIWFSYGFSLGLHWIFIGFSWGVPWTPQMLCLYIYNHFSGGSQGVPGPSSRLDLI